MCGVRRLRPTRRRRPLGSPGTRLRRPLSALRCRQPDQVRPAPRRGIDAGETRQFAGTGCGVEAHGIARFADPAAGADMDLAEAISQRPPRERAIGLSGRNFGDQHHHAGIGHHAGHDGGPADALVAILGREAKIGRQLGAQRIARRSLKLSLKRSGSWRSQNSRARRRAVRGGL